MKKRILALILAVFLLALTACGSGQQAEEPYEGDGVYYKVMELRDGYAYVVEWSSREHQTGLCTMGWEDDAEILNEKGEPITPADLRPGMVLDIRWDGSILESYPGQIHGVTAIRVVEKEDDLVGLYLSVLRELWETDPGLNGGAVQLGFDFSTLTNLTGDEKDALAYLASCEFGLGLQYVYGTWEELCDQGYIDRENLYWEDGVFISIEVSELEEDGMVFTAQKWRSGLGAIWLTDCVATRDKDGSWTYEPGGFAIS